MKQVHAALAAFSLFVWSAPLSSQTMNSLTAQEKAQGWQLLFDGKTLAGWHPAAPPQRQGPAPAPAAPPPQPGALAQVGSAPGRAAPLRSPPLPPAALIGKPSMDR